MSEETPESPEVIAEGEDEVTKDTASFDRKSPFDPRKIRAITFIDQVKAGVAPTVAAKVVHSDIRTLMNNPDVQELLLNWKATALERKELVLARMSKIVATGEPKDAVAASRVIVADPELGWQSAGNIQATQINIGKDTLEIINRAPKVAGLEEPEVIDVETND